MKEAESSALAAVLQDGSVALGEDLIGSVRASLTGEVDVLARPAVEDPGMMVRSREEDYVRHLA
ncbi:hypothetical protein ACQEXA_57050 [Streptomyces sp. CA-106110]